MLSPEELGLFRERIRFIDKKIQPGLTKLLWLSKGASNIFIRDCLLHVDKVVRLQFTTYRYFSFEPQTGDNNN